MGRFNRSGRHEVPGLNTSSLPDLIFTLLFFFMLATNMRDEPLKVKFTLPHAAEPEKLEQTSLVTSIYVGKPAEGSRSRLGIDSPLIQLNDTYVELSEIPDYIASEQASLTPADRPRMVVSLKIDRDIKMGTVADIKEALSKMNALNISYAASKRE